MTVDHLSPPADPPGLEQVVQAARRGDLCLAERWAEELVRVTPLGASEALPLANLRGAIAFELGRLDAAEASYELTLRLAAERQEHQLAAKAATNLGSIAHLRGKVGLALSLYHSALQAHRAERRSDGEAQVEHNLGLVERELGHLDRAEAHAGRAIQAARRADDEGLLGLVLSGAAETALARGRAQTARRLLATARRHARAAEDRLGLLDVRRIQALLAFDRSHHRLSVRHASAAYQGALRVRSLYLAGESAAIGARACDRIGWVRMAAAFRDRARRCFRATGAEMALRRLTADMG